MTPQPLHIFRKDLMHLWPETAAVIALFIAFAASAPSRWAGTEYAGFVVLLAVLLKVLMPISWVVLITRLIHDEPLVGDRQFWTSRPYHWAQLFAAKILYVVAFILLPFLIMQMYLLKRAGLHPMLVLPALGHNLLLVTVVILIPVAAIAAVTASFVRTLLSMLGAIVYVLIIIALVGWFTLLHMQAPHLDWVLNTVFIALPLVALVYQYRTRRTLVSRLLLVATPLLAGIIVLAVPATALISRAYPAMDPAKAPKFTSLSDMIHPPANPAGHLAVTHGNVVLSLPFKVEGVDEDSNYTVEGVRATVDGGGVHANSSSPYLTSLGTTQINGGTPASLLVFTLPESVFNKIHNTPVDLHLELAAEHLKANKPNTWKATLLPFSVPGNGVCTFSADDASQPPTCRFPLSQPEVGFVSARLAGGSCSTPSAPPQLGRGNLGGKNSTLDFDPVITVPLVFRTGDRNPQHSYLLCPGTDLNFVSADKLPNVRLIAEQKGIVLDPFAQRTTPQSANPGGNQAPGQPQGMPQD